MLKKSLQLTALAGALALASTAAQALTQTYTGEYGPGFTYVGTDWSGASISVPQFNPSTGTLTSVSVTFEGDIQSLMILDNDNNTAVTVIGSTNTNIFGSFAGLSLLVNPTTSTGPVTLGPNETTTPPDVDGPGDGGPDEVGPIPLAGSDTQNFTPALGAFIGAGTLTTTGLGTLAGFGVSGGGGNVDVSVSTEARARITVVYNYDTTQTPEPASLALMGLGLAGMGLLRRRQRSV